MSETHLHIHVPPGTELTFDGQTLTCRPAVAPRPDAPVVPMSEEELAAFLKEPNVDSG